MADGKKIPITITATGGDQAAAEFKKLEAALGIVDKSEKELAKNRAGFLTAAEAEVAEINRETAALDRAEKELNKYKTAQAGAAVAISKTGPVLAAHSQALNKVTQSGVKMGTGMQNVGYQVQDVAVQIGAGTSATQALGQQLPQLLSGFGPLGIAIGTVSAVAVPLAGALLGAGKAAETTSGQIDRLNTAIEKNKERFKESISAKREADNEAWIKSLDQEEQYYADLNSQVSRQIALQAKIRALKEGTASAEREAKIAEIEADPGKSEPDKIREVAALREEGAKAKAVAEKKALADEAAIAAAAAADAQALADRQTKDAAITSEARLKSQQDLAALEAKVVAAEGAQATLPFLQKQLGDEAYNLTVAQMGETPDMAAYEQSRKRKAEIASQIQRGENAIAAGAGAGKAAERVAEDLKNKREAEITQKNEASAARQAAKDAYGKSLYAEALAREGSPEIDRRYEAERRQRESRTGAALGKTVESEARGQFQDFEAWKAEQAKAERDTLGGDIDRRQESLDSDARTKGLSARNRGLGNTPGAGAGNATVAAVGKALQDGTNEGELQKLGDMVREAQGKNGAAITAMLMQVITGLNTQAKEIETMKKKLKNDR